MPEKDVEIERKYLNNYNNRNYNNNKETKIDERHSSWLQQSANINLTAAFLLLLMTNQLILPSAGAVR